MNWHDVASDRRRGLGAAAARAGLALVCGPYALGVRLRNALFDRGWRRTHQAIVPVISVGNLTLGGTGKTPCVEFLAAMVRDCLHRRPVILSRGYGSHDEALVLEENLPDVPHLQGVDRVALAAAAVEELEAEALILDDGFQHRRLARDADLVLIDATRPLSRSKMFPRGLLREPVSSLARADFAILTRCDQAADVDEQIAWLRRRFPNLPVATSTHRPKTWLHAGSSVLLPAYRERPVVAFCGVGNPEAFRQTLHSLQYHLMAFRVFPDHHRYTRQDVENLEQWAATSPPNAAVLTTQKDWVKLRLDSLADRPLAALKIGFELLSGEVELTRLLETRIGVLAD